MTLIQNLQKYVTNENIDYINELANIIIDEGINSIDDLQKYELNYNKENELLLTYDEIIEKCKKNIDDYPYEYDGLLYDKLQLLKEERKLMDSGNQENKILHIIKYYFLTNRDNPFPYMTYQFIIQGKL